jgi:tryptophan synthase alpha chain
VNRIKKTFINLKENKRTAMMPYLTLGYPEKESALQIIPALVRGGADLVELGVPFSDPLADGATIQASSQRALDNGINLPICLTQAEQLRETGITIPFVLMGYFNPIMQFGVAQFVDRASEAGIDGVIVPDLPPEEAGPLVEALNEKDICSIFLLAPTSDANRIHTVVNISEGFIYLVSLVGVTGARATISPELAGFVKRIRQETTKPLAVGFGISTPDQAAHIGAIADGVIVGSALIMTISDVESPAQAAHDFVKALRDGIDSE